MRFLAFDLETTGLDQQHDRIMEFCFIEVDEQLQVKGEPYTELVHPGVPIPAKVQQITQITDDMVRDRPAFAHFAPRIQKLVQGATMIAHNHRFDIPFLHNELVRAGQPGLDANHPCVDTCSIERIVNSHSLEATYRRYVGADMPVAHRSQADTEATVEVLRRQLAVHKDILGDSVAALTQSNMVRLKDPEADVRTWLDHGHRFYQDEDGIPRFGFGKHRGEPARSHEGFLHWMKSRDFPPDTLRLVDQFLKEVPARNTA
jgi:DNA polymerase III alpha subunit (gram-positive type)